MEVTVWAGLTVLRYNVVRVVLYVSIMFFFYVLGHIDVWHGYADILVEKSSVKVVQVSSDGDKDESESDEPVAKKKKERWGWRARPTEVIRW